jgi:hypothetical protein
LRCMDMVVILEFCKWKKFHPIVLLFAHKKPEVLFEFLVDMFPRLQEGQEWQQRAWELVEEGVGMVREQ